MPLATRTKKQFIGFKNKVQLKKHIKREFPKSQVKNIGKRETLKASVKGGRTATSYTVSFKKRRKK